jgi:hypothetical protein
MAVATTESISQDNLAQAIQMLLLWFADTKQTQQALIYRYIYLLKANGNKEAV